MSPARRLVTTAAVLTAAFAAVTTVSVTTTANAAPAPYVNPLANHPWGIYKGTSDGLWPAFQASSGAQRRLLAKEATEPRVRRYTSYIPAADLQQRVENDIIQEQQGNPNVLVWTAMFALWPKTEANLNLPLSIGEQNAYRAWVNAAARGIGSSRVAIVLEPDLPVVLSGWRPRVRLGLARYAARTFSSLPNTTVYLDAGSADWFTRDEAASLLERAGVAYAHGFALGSSHHVKLGAEIAYGRRVALSLAQAGVPGKHFVVDTSDNGHGYTNHQFYAKYPHGSTEAAPACKTATQKVCVALGAPPTTNTARALWGFRPAVRQAARRFCDAFIWAGHPWKTNNDRSFSMVHALNAARTSPF